MSVGEVEGEAGRSVRVPVYLQNNDYLDLFGITFTYDHSKLESPFFSREETILEEYDLIFPTFPRDGEIFLAFDNFFGVYPTLSASGLLIYFEFSIKEAASGFAEIRIDETTEDLRTARHEHGGVTISTSANPTPQPTFANPTPTPNPSFPTPFPTENPGYTDTHPSDSDQNWIVDDFEILGYIDSWANGQVDDFALLGAIDLWACPSDQGYTTDIDGNWICMP